MTDIVERLRELLAKATPGPWHVSSYYLNSGTPDEIVRGMLVSDDDYSIGIIDERDSTEESLSHDLELIAEVRSALPDLLDRAERLRSLEQQVGEGWRPIETAPKDGTNILLFGPRLAVCVGQWRGERPAGFHAWSSDWIGWTRLAFQDRPLSPSHWQPLPPPPGEQSQSAGSAAIMQTCHVNGCDRPPLAGGACEEHMAMGCPVLDDDPNNVCDACDCGKSTLASDGSGNQSTTYDPVRRAKALLASEYENALREKNAAQSSDDLEQRARELLASAYGEAGNKAAAFTLRKVGAVGTKFSIELNAVLAALRSSESERARGIREAADWIRENMARVGSHNGRTTADVMEAELLGEEPHP